MAANAILHFGIHHRIVVIKRANGPYRCYRPSSASAKRLARYTRDKRELFDIIPSLDGWSAVRNQPSELYSPPHRTGDHAQSL